ncbi:MAG: rhodanese-like domain-containing protein [Chthoniobacterales bacterium]|nr:rhodanese-like domain-containing protein [Chthoniobacterales bacterium]
MKTIPVNELKTLLGRTLPPRVIDVRTPAEFEAIHVPEAQLTPLDTLDCASILAEREKSGDVSPIAILCHSGGRAKQAAKKFAAAGFQDCLVVEGGTQAWADEGYPVVRGERRVLPLDRQLQIVIGLLVLTGVLLSQFLNSAWIWLSGFVGCGMIFAGLSGICLMRSLIAKMPWNQGGAKSAGTCCGI